MQRRASALIAFGSAALAVAATVAVSSIGGVTAAAAELITTPTNVAVTSTSGNSIGLSWSPSAVNDSTGDVAAYYVYNGSNIVATSMGTSVTVSSLKPSTSYTFTVEAYDQAGNTSAQSSPVSATTSAPSASTYYKTAYYTQWSIYGNGYDIANVNSTGVASKLTTLIYAFENIDPTNLTCFETIKASDSTNESDPNAGDGAGDAYADYQDTNVGSVDGSTTSWSQPLKGSFNQLRELKVKNPKLRVLLSIGGWTYSKYFSDVAATAASRQKFVSSCIDMFLKGNLPTGIGGDSSGGPASAAGIFDGFDLDWEYPGGGGHVGNHYSAADKQNFTLLLQEFRTELDSYGDSIGKHFLLTAAVPSGQDKLMNIETDKIGNFLDYADAMTYDMHGAWDATGPTNFQDPLYASSSDPSNVIPPGNEKYDINTTITAWTSGLPDYGVPGGFPASKLVMGFPFYYRGWTGVPAGSDYGLYQSATGSTASQQYSGQAGIAFYKEISSTINTDSHYDPTTMAAWAYDGTNFWTGDTAQSIANKTDCIKSHSLAGAMMWSLEDLDPQTTLLNDVVNGLTGSSGGGSNDFSVSVSPASGSVTAGNSTTASVSTAVTSGSAESVSLSASGAPSGVSVSFSPSSVNSGSSSTMTVSTSSSAVAGTYTITVTGTASSGSHSASYSLTVNSSSGGGGNGVANGGFESGSLSPWTCQPGDAVVTSPVHSGSYAAAVVPTSSQTGECDQSVTLSPNTSYTLTGYVEGNYAYLGVSGGATASTWTSSSTWTQLSVPFTTDSTGQVTVYVHGWYSEGTVYADDISIPGTSGGTSNDFSISASPNSGSLTAGSSTTTTVNTAVTSGNAESVSLSASGAPSGVSVSFNPSSVTSGSSSTMTISTTSSATAGTYTITVTGTASSGSHSTGYTLTVNAQASNDFSISASPNSGSLTAGSSTTTTVNTAVTSGNAESVSLSASGAPSGVSVSFNPSSVTSGSSSTMNISTSSSAAAGTYTITITGSASSGSHSASYSLTVNASSSGGGGSLSNGGFETGSLSPWTCQPGDGVVTSPVHSGSYAVAVVPTSSQTGECDQTVTLSPNTSYTLTGWVQGNYAYIGVSGDASASTWTSSSSWTQLTVTFTTGSTGQVTVYVHGWYSQGNVYADDFAIS